MLWKKQPNGSGHIMDRGYVRRMIDYETSFDHIRIVETAIGHPLAFGVQIHHVDGNPSNNSPSNLVVCQDAAYHMLLHLRTNAISLGFPANYRKCRFCKQYDAPENLAIFDSGIHHRFCMNKYYRDKRRSNGKPITQPL